MLVEETDIAGVLVITPKRIGDERGFLSETFKADALRGAGIAHGWSQDNHAYSAARGVLRGLHFQRPPCAQAKLVRVTRGIIYDVAVDIRSGSPTYGRHVGLELSAENWKQLYVPAGFAHGYCTLSADAEVQYKLSEPYAPQAEGGLAWDDPELGIAWPLSAEEISVNARDRAWPRLAGFITPF